jgi:hypothetical protein
MHSLVMQAALAPEGRAHPLAGDRPRGVVALRGAVDSERGRALLRTLMDRGLPVVAYGGRRGSSRLRHGLLRPRGGVVRAHPVAHPTRLPPHPAVLAAPARPAPPPGLAREPRPRP